MLPACGAQELDSCQPVGKQSMHKQSYNNDIARAINIGFKGNFRQRRQVSPAAAVIVWLARLKQRPGTPPGMGGTPTLTLLCRRMCSATNGPVCADVGRQGHHRAAQYAWPLLLYAACAAATGRAPVPVKE